MSVKKACVALVGMLLWGLCLSPPINAADTTTDCDAVEKQASLVGSDRLIVNVASDKSKKYCRFFVSLPPPGSNRTAATNWYNAAASMADSKALLNDVVGLAVAAIPQDDPRIKEVAVNILGNNVLVSECITVFLKRGQFSGISKDGVVSCSAQANAHRMSIKVSLGNIFSSTLILPRPS